jgi:hypothetical protein
MAVVSGFEVTIVDERLFLFAGGEWAMDVDFATARRSRGAVRVLQTA